MESFMLKKRIKNILDFWKMVSIKVKGDWLLMIILIKECLTEAKKMVMGNNSIQKLV